MSANTEAAEVTRSSPRMGFGRWLTVLGWRHAIAIVAVALAILPITYIIGVALNPVGSLSASCPPEKTGLAAVGCLIIPA